MPVTLYTRATQAAAAASVFESSISETIYNFDTGVTYAEIHEQLLALGPTPDPDDVDRILARSTVHRWTSIVCDICNVLVDAAVYVNDGYQGGDSVGARICRSCLQQATALLFDFCVEHEDCLALARACRKLSGTRA